jgi:O-antigen/teichoic acid export membrane protein
VKAGTRATCDYRTTHNEFLVMSAEAMNVLAVQQNERSSWRADFSWMFVGNAVYAGGQFAILMLLAKLLQPEYVGQYALALAVVYPVIQFTNLQLRAVITSDARRGIHFGHYFSLRVLTTLLALTIIFFITQILKYGRELTSVVLMVGVAYAVEAISDVYYARLQLYDRMAEISKSLIARAMLSVLALAVVTYLSGSLLWGVVGIVIARAIVLFCYDICGRIHGLEGQSGQSSRNQALAPRFDLKVQRELLWLSLPLGLVVLLSCLNSSVPNYFIKHVLGERDLGIFAAIGFAMSVGSMVVVSLGQSAFTRLARSYAAGNLVVFGSLLGRLLAFGAALGACGMILSKLAGRGILTILFRPEYAERADLLPWTMAVGGVLYMAQFVGFGLTAAGYYNSQVVLNILANLSLLAGCYWLVARQGLLGAILAMLIAAIVQLVASLIILVAVVSKHTHKSAEGIELARCHFDLNPLHQNRKEASGD